MSAQAPSRADVAGSWDAEYRAGGYDGGPPVSFTGIIRSYVTDRMPLGRGPFARTASLLRPGGLPFLRVNSDRTGIRHGHRVVERDGGTIMYEEGPQEGPPDPVLYGGIRDLAGGFDILRTDHATEPRASGGSRSRWECVLERLAS